MPEDPDDLDAIDWGRLRGLRDGFLDGSAGQADYWRSDADLTLYDRFLGERIGWKWDAVIAELKLRAWAPPCGVWMDWGCGPGVAIRRMLAAFPERCAGVCLVDRSTRARDFARARLSEEFPGLSLRALDPLSSPEEPPALLLVSHVLSEISPEREACVWTGAAQAQALVWVEPGTYAESRRLVAARESLLSAGWSVVAPCLHAGPCGLTQSEGALAWCHHFAKPPKGIGADAAWGRFAREMGVDLRSLPYAFLAASRSCHPLPPDAGSAVTARLLGRPQTQRAGLAFTSCEKAGIRARELPKRSFKPIIKAIEKGRAGPAFHLTEEGGAVTAIKEIFPAEP
jgi:SAM-dependent methyltransferase